MSMAGEWRARSSQSVAAAAASGHLIPLGELETHFPREATAAGLAYTESFQAVQFLMGRSGIGRTEELVAAVAGAGGCSRKSTAL